MITIVFSLLLLAFFCWITKARQTAALASVFLLFSLMTRVIGLCYVDVVGPLYSDQLETFIGGSPSMPLFAVSVLAFLVPLAYAFRLSALKKRVAVAGRQLLYNPLAVLNVVFALLIIFVATAYCDMLMRGPIPLLSGIDRLEYNSNFAGSLHAILNSHGFMIAFLLGLVFAYPRIFGKDFRVSAVVLYILIIVYFALTGNRFSAFYVFTSFFVIPIAAVRLSTETNRLAPPPHNRAKLVAFIVSPKAIYLALVSGGLLLLALLVNSVVYVRLYDDPTNLFIQRTLVQPIELWWMTWAGLQDISEESVGTAWHELFVSPIDATRNTSVRLLMINALGYDRALELAVLGTQFAGGYPEIFFELLGPWLATPTALVFGIVTVLLLRLVVVSTFHGRLGTAILALYVYYGFTLLYIGGMLNFLIAWTYWVKCAALFVVYLAERGCNANHLPRSLRHLKLPFCTASYGPVLK